MKKLIFTVVVTLSIFLFNAQAQQFNSDWIAAHYYKLERYITMRDGVKLFTSIYIPKDTTKSHPILIKRTPYSCAPYGEDKFYIGKEPSQEYLKEGYIMVIQDVRGRFMSEGVFEDVRPFIPNKKSKTDIDESTDAYDSIDWLVKNVPNNNGNVGMCGISYPGFYAAMAGCSNHPALKAISPQAPVTDWFIGDDFHHKGVPFILDAFDFFRFFGVVRDKLTQTWPDSTIQTTNDNYQFFLNAGTYKEINSKYFANKIKFLNDAVAHPNYDEWWKIRNARNAYYNIKAPILVVGGLFDAEDCYGAWNTYKSIEKQSQTTNCKIVEGPWFHGGWTRSAGDRLGNVWFNEETSDYYLKNFELPFFNYYLKNEGDINQISEANIFITGENKWNKFNQWPPKDIVSKNLYLHKGETLSFIESTSPNSFDQYTSDPNKPVPYIEDVHWKRTREYMTDDQRFASRRPDVLVYKTDILEDPITLTGPVIADLFTSISTTDADFVVKLIDVFPDDFKYPDSVKITYPMGGYQMLVRGEILRGRFRNSFDKPEPFKPNKISEVKFELPDIAHTFQKGHRIMIQIQSTWYPLADRNPQQFVDPYNCTSKDLIKSEIKIYSDSKHGSKIILPILTNHN